MGRKRVTGMYRNVDFRVGRRGAADAIIYERTFRLSNAEFIRHEKEKKGPFKRVTDWWSMRYPKNLPGEYTPRMARQPG